MEFIETTEIDERAIRRLALSKGLPVHKNGPEYWISGISLTDDECWSVLSALPSV